MYWYEILRELREGINPRLSQKTIASELKMTQGRISRLETGVSNPTIDDIKLFCRYYNVSADYLLGLTREKKPFPKK